MKSQFGLEKKQSWKKKQSRFSWVSLYITVPTLLYESVCTVAATEIGVDTVTAQWEMTAAVIALEWEMALFCHLTYLAFVLNTRCHIRCHSD